MGSIVKFKFKKIDADIKSDLLGEVNISNNVAIKDVKQDGANMLLIFAYTTKYIKDNQDMATLLFGGHITYKDEEDKIKGYIADWARDKKLPKDIMTPLLNFVLTRCNIESLKMAQIMNLPSPIPLPEVQVK